MPKVDPASTTAAMLGCAQAAAAVMGVLAVWATADGLLDIPQAEQVAVGILTLLVAAALGHGCARTLTGHPVRPLIWGFVGSLVISAYWIVLRPPAIGFPAIPVVYAALPVFGLVLLAGSAARSRRRPVDAPDTSAPPSPDDLVAGQPHVRDQPGDHPEAQRGRDMLIE